jgi:hypothetical protein
LLLFDRDNWPPHRPWLVFCLAAFLAASAWFVAAGLGQPEWPGGSSLPGLTFGIVGGLLILFEFLLWLRKKVRVWRLGRAQAWLRAHIWLGLLCVPLLVYHSGLRWGGTLSAVLLALVLIVVASGIYGLVLQQSLPRRMLEDISAETIYSQMERLAAQLSVEAARLVEATCGPAAGEETVADDEEPGRAYLVVGAVRSAGQVQGKVLKTQAPASPIAEAEPLRQFFHDAVVPFLRDGNRSGSPLAGARQAMLMFQDLKTKVPAAAHEAVAVLEGFCSQRRQWDEQARLHFWLHSWLWIHFPLSVALVVLMFVHVWVALKYW